MIRRFQSNVAGFAGAFSRLWTLQPVVQEHQYIAVTPGTEGANNQLILLTAGRIGGMNVLGGGMR